MNHYFSQMAFLQDGRTHGYKSFLFKPYVWARSTQESKLATKRLHEKGDGAKKKVKMLAINLEAVTHDNRGKKTKKQK